MNNHTIQFDKVRELAEELPLDKVRELAEELPLHWRIRLIEVLEESLPKSAHNIPAPLTDVEVAERMKITPLSNKEIVDGGYTGGWEDLGINDPVEWKKQQQKRRRERHQW